MKGNTVGFMLSSASCRPGPEPDLAEWYSHVIQIRDAWHETEIAWSVYVHKTNPLHNHQRAFLNGALLVPAILLMKRK